MLVKVNVRVSFVSFVPAHAGGPHARRSSANPAPAGCGGSERRHAPVASAAAAARVTTPAVLGDAPELGCVV